MALALSAETEDLLTCSVCLIEYDREERRPKFLQCAHTACIKCLELIWKDGYILCPICRKKSHCEKGTIHLSNNLYALHMIEMQKRHTQTINKLLEPCWCFNCRRIANISCLESHLLIGIPIDKITLGDNLQNMVDDCKTNLGMASNRIRGVEENLELLANLLKAAENGIREKIKNNRKRVQQFEQAQNSLTRTGEVLESYSSFMERVMKLTKEVDLELKQMSHEDDMNKNLNIFIQIEKDKQTIPTFYGYQDGFCRDVDSPELKLLHHMVLSILKRRKIPLNPLTPPPVAPFTTFIVSIYTKEEQVGQLRIKPSAVFHDVFLKELRDFCFNHKQIFECTISKVKSDMFAILDFQNSQFQPKEPQRWSGEVARKSLDVGFGRYSSQDGRITGWELVFFAEDVSLKRLILFGRIIRGQDVICVISNRCHEEGGPLKAVWELA